MKKTEISEGQGAWNMRPWRPRVRPPTLMTREELAYLHWLSAEWVRGPGAAGGGRICELGCFLGGSTAALASGLAERSEGRSLPPVLTFDAFVWWSGMEAWFPTGLPDGASFRAVTERNLGELLRHVKLHTVQFPEETTAAGARALYPEDEPVEVLFVDCAKSWGSHKTILRAFTARLIPGRSLLVHQDFKHHTTFWLPIHMHALREYFRPVHEVVGGSTMTFEYLGGLDDATIAALPTAEELAGAERIERMWDEVERWWAERDGPAEGCGARMGLACTLGRALHHAFHGEMEACWAALDRFPAGYNRLRRERPGDPFHLNLHDEWQWALDAVRGRMIERLKGGRERVAAEELWPAARRVDRLRSALFPAASW